MEKLKFFALGFITGIAFYLLASAITNAFVNYQLLKEETSDYVANPPVIEEKIIVEEATPSATPTEKPVPTQFVPPVEPSPTPQQ